MKIERSSHGEQISASAAKIKHIVKISVGDPDFSLQIAQLDAVKRVMWQGQGITGSCFNNVLTVQEELAIYFKLDQNRVTAM